MSGLNPRIRIILPSRYRAAEVYTIEFEFNARALDTGSTITKRDQRRKTPNKENIVNLHLMIGDVDPFVPNILVSVRVCAFYVLFFHLLFFDLINLLLVYDCIFACLLHLL